jgi:tricorn protease
VIVRLLESESRLRYLAWVEDNRAYVERKTGGKVGYVHLAGTYEDAVKDFARQFYGQKDREALIIDARWNLGGRWPDGFIDLLSRPLYFHFFRRQGIDGRVMDDIALKPKCLLINGVCISGGDSLADFFRHARLGKLIGTRTTGGLTGPGFPAPFIDGGAILVPEGAPYDRKGR